MLALLQGGADTFAWWEYVLGSIVFALIGVLVGVVIWRIS